MRKSQYIPVFSWSHDLHSITLNVISRTSTRSVKVMLIEFQPVQSPASAVHAWDKTCLPRHRMLNLIRWHTASKIPRIIYSASQFRQKVDLPVWWFIHRNRRIDSLQGEDGRSVTNCFCKGGLTRWWPIILTKLAILLALARSFALSRVD